MTDDDSWGLSRRKLLGTAGTIGAAGALGGAATTSLLWDEEKFGNVTNPNVLQAGELDLKVDWEGTYYNWIDNPTFSSDTDGDGEPDFVDQPGPIIDFRDIKPGDVLEVTLSAHVFGNPAFLGAHYQEHDDSENDVPEPEDKVNSHDPDGWDGSDPQPDEDGELDEYIQCVFWYDDGDNLPDEVFPDLDDDDDGELDVDEEDYVMAVSEIQDAAATFGGNDAVIVAGTLGDIDFADVVLDARDSVSGAVADDFPDTACYQNSVTEYIGMLCWVPRDIPGVNDNIIQDDSLRFQFGVDAIQCRHNVANDGGPIDGTIDEADADNNARSP